MPDTYFDIVIFSNLNHQTLFLQCKMKQIEPLSMLRPILLTKSSCLIIETKFSINSRLLFIASLIVASKFDFDSRGLLRKGWNTI